MEGNWLLLEGNNGWKYVVPDCDSKPHAKIIIDLFGEKTAELADMTCPCNPVVDYINKIIIHNAFDGRD